MASRPTRASRRALTTPDGLVDLSFEMLSHVCDFLTAYEACALLLGRMFHCHHVVALLRSSPAGQRFAAAKRLGSNAKVLEHCLGREVDTTSMNEETARAWLGLPAPFTAALLTATSELQGTVLKGAALIGLLPLALIHARAVEHGGSVTERASGHAAPDAAEAAKLVRKLTGVNVTSSSVFEGAFESLDEIRRDSDARFTPIYDHLLFDIELRRQAPER